MYFSWPACFSCKETEDDGGGEGGGGHGWLLGNNNALLTDWKVSPSLSPPFSLVLSPRAGRILPAVAQQQLFELPVALVTAAGENGG